MSSASMPAAANAERPTDLHQPIPQRDALLGVDPQLVAQVAGVAGPADVELDLAGVGRPSVVVAQVGPVGVGQRLEDVARERALQGDRGGRLADVVDRRRRGRAS